VPAVSVIVPTRDRRVLLERKLRALELEQLDFEVIVVADACTDDTEKFLAAYRPPHRLRWTTGPGLSAATARTLGAARARALELEPLDCEVIVVAAACTDDTEKFLAAYRPPYRFSWTTGPGLHAATARNIGASRAQAPVLLFSDDDVIPGPGWVEDNRRLH